MRFTVQAPDGRKVTLEGNHTPTEQELNQVFGSVGENNKQNKSYALGRLGTIDRGVTFGLGRKLGGVINAIGAYPVDRVAQAMGVENTPSFMERYHEIVDPTMEAINQYHEDKPVEALSLELGAALVNPANKVGVNFIKGGKGLVNTALRSGAVGSGVGTVAGALNTEKTEDVLPYAFGGGVGGAALGTALPVAANRAGAVYNAIKRIAAPEASVAGKATGLSNIVKDNESVRTLSRGIMADDAVAAQVLQEAPSEMGRLNEELTDILNKTTGRKLNIEGAKKNADEAYRSYIAKNADYPVYNPKSAQEQSAENFKRWFEGSQIVDENGQPLKLYHGTDADFDAFDMSKGRSTMDIQGAFFSPYDIDAKGYGSKLKEVYLNIKNPADEATAYKALRKYQGQNYAGLKAKQDLQRQGFDGVFNGYDEYIAFEPNQIKSVNNSGAWSSSPSLSDAGWKAEPSLKNIIGGLNNFKQNAMNKALAEGAAMSDYPVGSLDAVHKAQGVLNDMIEASYDKSVLGVKRPTTETTQLMDLKQVFNNMLEPSGVKPLDARISKAKSLDYFRDMGYKFKPSEKKFEDLGIKTLRDKRAFLQGRLQAILDNVKDDKNLAKAIRADENTLKKLMPAKKFSELLSETSRIDREYTRLNKLAQKASHELDKPISADRPMSERSETKMSYLGSLYDKANARMWQNANRRRAQALLNGGAVNPEWLQTLENYGTQYSPRNLTPYLAQLLAENQ